MNSVGSLFDWFLSATARGSLLILAVLLAQTALGRRLPAVWRHALWLPVFFVLGAPILPESPLSLENRWSLKTHLPMGVKPEGSVSPPDGPTNPQPAEPAAAAPFPWKRLAGTIWSIGVLTALLAGATAYRRALAAFRREEQPCSRELQQEIGEAARACGLRHVPGALVSNALPGPAVTGLFQPVLLVPATFTEVFEPEERRLILLHEFTHVKRGDLLLNAIAFVLQALHWCNPLVWFAFARFRADRELACDSVVLSASDDDRRGTYGNALLKVETAVSAPTRHLTLVGLVGLFGRGRSLRSRLSAIAAHRRNHPTSTWTGLLLLLGLAFAGATRARQPPLAPPDAQVVIETRFIEVPADAKIEITSQRATLDPKTSTMVFSADADFAEELASIPGADFLSAPSVTTLSGHKATIEIGPQVPDADDQPRRAGVTFEVLPTVRDETIHLALHLRVTNPQPGSAAFGERQIKTNVTVRPGEWLIVSPLVKEGDAAQDRRLLLTVRSRLAEGASAAAPVEVKKSKTAELAARTILGRVEFQEASLRQAIQFLQQKSVELDPAQKGLNVILNVPGEPSPDGITLTLSLNEVPLSEALRYVAELANCKIRYDEDAVVIFRD